MAQKTPQTGPVRVYDHRGTGALRPEHARLEDWRAVHRVNLDGTFLGCRYAIRAMKEAGTGSIINISSRSGLVGIPLAARLRLFQSGHSQSHQKCGVLLRTTGLEDSMQLNPSIGHPYAYLGTNAGHWS